MDALVEPLPFRSEFLCALDVEVGPVISLGIGPYGERRVVDIVGGRVRGDGMAGRIAAGGADWQVVRADGAVDIEAHYSLVLDDEARVEIVSSGLRFGPGDTLQRLGRGEAIDPSRYFFRTFVRFQTGAARLEHLNRTMAVAIGARRRANVELTVYRVL